MSPDDVRHGTHAGSIQHWRAGEKPCPPCAAAARRLRKHNDLRTLRGQSPTVPLGRAWEVINTAPLNELTVQTGMAVHRLIRYRQMGQTAIVHRTTRDRILAVTVPWTVVGVQRRLRALTVLGWSMREVAERAGVGHEAAKRIRRAESRSFIRRNVAAAICDVYDVLCDEDAPSGRSSVEVRAKASASGWAPPSAWLDIDDPDETPDPGYRTPHWRAPDDYDFAVVARLLAGDFALAAMTSRAEKEAVCAAWVARGDSANELERLTNWNVRRYVQSSREREAS